MKANHKSRRHARESRETIEARLRQFAARTREASRQQAAAANAHWQAHPELHSMTVLAGPTVPVNPNREIARQLALLARSFARNLAFHRSGYMTNDGSGPLRDATEMGATISDNFLDIAVLAWCKLFADWDGRHHWRRFAERVTTREGFMAGMLDALAINHKDWNLYIVQVRTYRDRFAAHRNAEAIHHRPDLTLALNSARFLYQYVHAHSPEGTFDNSRGPTIPENLEVFYDACRREARAYTATYRDDTDSFPAPPRP